MLYPQQLESKIGFDKIRTLIQKECLSNPAKEKVESLRFQTDIQKISLQITLCDEFLRILKGEEVFPHENYIDATSFLNTSKIEGSILNEEAFYTIKSSLQTINRCLQFLTKYKLEVPNLFSLTTDILIDAQLLKDINRIIDENGKVKDGASKELFSLRNEIRDEQNFLRKKLESILKSAIAEGFSPEDLGTTIRNGRMVLPVFAESKRKIKGLIHGESATGQTVFIEPIEVFDANNRVYELEIAERREVSKILMALTSQLRYLLPELFRAYQFLAEIDFIRAKAKFSLKINAQKQRISSNTEIKWHETYHPLLHLNLKTNGKKIVPLSIDINENQKIIVISGPNAGGKSVVLKTIGLLQYMHQCGLLIPNGESCIFGIYNAMFIDIGDEQSIDNDLSTYSSHLTNMREILKYADKKSLVLIDEFGTGTDPQYGGALAEAILEELVIKNINGAINTHYSNLKYFTEKTKNITNAAMLYDYETLSPKYQLAIGQPGNSFALEIAQNIGLKKEVIELAKQKIGFEKLNLDSIVIQVQLEKEKLEKEKTEIAKSRKNLEVSVEQYEELKKHISQSKNIILHEARLEAKKMVQIAKIETSNLIRELKETQKFDLKQTEKVRTEIQAQEKKWDDSILKNPVTKEKATAPVPKGPLKIGDTVTIEGQESFYKILSISEKEAELSLGNFKTNVKIERIRKVNVSDKVKKENYIIPKIKGIDILEKMSNFSSTLDVRGKRGEEAVHILEQYLDNALLLSQNDFKIIHGKGDGILRKLIREHLKRTSFVKNFCDEKVEFGGDGITIVTLK
ncbi:MAG: endonuclease MutS2 [Cytophagales bacterium]|nr:MAG: endonuclease MutS2 [Cytophagales bacterium]